MKIAEIRNVINSLNWTRNDLSGATTQEFKTMDVAARMAPRIAECKALQIPARFTADIESCRNAIERGEAAVTRWRAMQDTQAAKAPQLP